MPALLLLLLLLLALALAAALGDGPGCDNSGRSGSAAPASSVLQSSFGSCSPMIAGGVTAESASSSLAAAAAVKAFPPSPPPAPSACATGDGICAVEEARAGGVD